MRTAIPTIDEAKYILLEKCGSDSVFPHGVDFNYGWYGYYSPKLTIVLPAHWPIDERGNARCPIRFAQADRLARLFKFDFGETAKGGAPNIDALFVSNFRTSSNGRPVVNLASPDSFEQFLLRVHYGSDSKTSGRGDIIWDYEKYGILHFARTPSKSKLSGYDWYVIPKTWRLTDDGRTSMEAFCDDVRQSEARAIEAFESRYDELWNPESKPILDFIASNSARIADLSKRLRGIAVSHIKIDGTCIKFGDGNYIPFTDENLTKVEIVIRKNELFREHLADFDRNEFKSTVEYEEAVRNVVRDLISKEFTQNQLRQVNLIPSDSVNTYGLRPAVEIRQIDPDAPGHVLACPFDTDPDGQCSSYRFYLDDAHSVISLVFSGDDSAVTDQALLTVLAHRMAGNGETDALRHIEAAAMCLKANSTK